MPHVIPVMYALDGEKVVVAIDYGTRKLKNLKENPKVSLVVDEYNPNRAVFIPGHLCDVREVRSISVSSTILFKKFEVYRKNPWGEGESRS